MSYYIDNDREFAPMSLNYPLIHWVKTWNVLIAIINQGFKPSYCKEFISDNERSIVAAFPMVSFSNMDVTTSINLMRSYGTLGIAMKKNWGSNNKFNPVLYLERNSDYTKQIIENFEIIKKYKINEIISCMEGGLTGERHLLVKAMVTTFSYAKNYDARLERGGEVVNEQYPFGLEREWRLIIRNKECKPFLIGEEINKKSEYSKAFENTRIDFCCEDIDSIIVETDYERDEIITILQTRFGANCTLPTIRINSTRHIPDYD